jgi:4-carboxymuconolactone decarboxylase
VNRFTYGDRARIEKLVRLSSTRLPYAIPAQLSTLMRQSGLPEHTPQTNAFRMLAHSPETATRALRLVLTLLTETTLDPKLRDLVILRVAQRCAGEYVWAQHVPIARTSGVSESQIAALERGEAQADLFGDAERAVFALADEVLAGGRCTQDTFDAVRKLFSCREVVELLMLVGYFRMMSDLLTTLNVELEPALGPEILERAWGPSLAATD